MWGINIRLKSQKILLANFLIFTDTCKLNGTMIKNWRSQFKIFRDLMQNGWIKHKTFWSEQSKRYKIRVYTPVYFLNSELTSNRFLIHSWITITKYSRLLDPYEKQKVTNVMHSYWKILSFSHHKCTYSQLKKLLPVQHFSLKFSITFKLMILRTL